MIKNIIIQSETAHAIISPIGAELKSFNDGTEYIWMADKNIWGRSGPVLFPICGKLKNDKYYFENNTYHLQPHGFAKDSEFKVIEKSTNSVTFLLESNYNTKTIYPFDFKFYVNFSLYEKKLSIKYFVYNSGENVMYFSFGGHEGYSCPEGVEKYTVKFNNDLLLKRHMIKGGILTGEIEATNIPNGILNLKYDEFARGTYMFKELKSTSVILSNNTDRTIKVNFDGFTQLALWTLPGRKYLCIEPWCGFSQTDSFDGNLKNKDAIISLEPKKTFEKTHSIEILDQ